MTLSEPSRSKLRSESSIDGIEQDDPELGNATDLLYEIPNAYEQAHLGLKQGKEGRTIALDEL
jgi:hypothetical protein